MQRTYNAIIDNGLFIAEYYLKKDYTQISEKDLKNNIHIFSSIIGKILESNDFFKKLPYITHMNSCLTQPLKNCSREDKIEEQLIELCENIGNDKYCIYCGEKRVNKNYIIDRKLVNGIVSMTFFNSANNLQSIDICPICAYLSLLAILNINKIGMPTVYISDNDELMRKITRIQQEKIDKEDEGFELKGTERDNHFVNLIIDTIDIDINYLTQFRYQNAGQVITQEERTLENDDILLIKELHNNELLDEFMAYGLFKRLFNKTPLINSILTNETLCCSEKLYKILEEFELKEKERNIVESVTNNLIKLETIDKLLKELKLCSSKDVFGKYKFLHSGKKFF